MDEFNLIKKYFHPLTNNSKESQNLEDDVALIAGNSLVVSKDLTVEDVHFRASDGAYNIASRLLRSNLSDIAASGAKPLYYLLGFCKNQHVDEEFVRAFSEALSKINKEFKIFCIGGDTVKSTDKLFFSVTIFGQKARKKDKKILSRKNAANEDLIFVSGFIGDAFLGRKIAEKSPNIKNINASDQIRDQKYLIKRYYEPDPRIKLGQELIKQGLSKCAIDVSDGLFSDLRHICKSSKLSATIFQSQIPISNQANKILRNCDGISKLDLFSAGDDYELIFTAKKANLKKINNLAKKLKIPLSNIGYLQPQIPSKEIINLFNGEDKINITKFGYEH